jgi:OPA family glycerol-3-phosphate transporter-like MFS transporter 3
MSVLILFSYAFFHATRKTFSNVKSTISDEWSPSYHNNTVNYTKPDTVSITVPYTKKRVAAL